MEFNGKKISFDLLRDHHLLDHLILKMLLNAHSTLLMGRKGFYQSNIMTWVKASNNKLIDRASRYVQYLGRIESLNWDYEEVVRAIIKMKSLGEQKGPIVLRAFEYLKSKTS
jgi:N-acetylmuramic acid 6-phosphate etherase